MGRVSELNRRLLISVVGGSRCDEDVAEAAAEVGGLLAEAGAVVICGGYGGVMEAVCRGAAAVGGLTVGLLRGYDHDEGNPYLSLALPTGLNLARNTLVAAAGRAVIAIDGSFGTLSEIALALNLNRPVVGLRSWTLDEAARRVQLGRYRGVIHTAEDPESAVEMALELAGGSR
ncbi:MAG: TIGR00725 family protein [Candidatus Coatesbacteria bacterium]|nr:TIGR00725 family protein [Candidatus Coatesbacteria bacterium]